MSAVRTVGFIGLGQMGQLMAANLAKGGYAVQSYDVRGTGNRQSAADAARGAEVLVTMLPDGKAVRKAVTAALPGLARRTIVVDMSSSDPEATRGLYKILKPKGIRLLDVPVSGSKTGARDATLALMVGGDASALERIRPVLEKMGNRIFHMGGLGTGHAMKALNNYIGGSGTIAAFESVLIGQAYGLDLKLMTEVLNASTGYNSTTQRKIPMQILTGAFASGFSAALMTKDIGIAASVARAARLPAPYLSKTLQMWRAALATFPAGADHTEIYRWLQKSKLKRR